MGGGVATLKGESQFLDGNWNLSVQSEFYNKNSAKRCNICLKDSILVADNVSAKHEKSLEYAELFVTRRTHGKVIRRVWNFLPMVPSSIPGTSLYICQLFFRG